MGSAWGLTRPAWGPMGSYGPNVATELEAALAADLSGGSGGAEPPS